MTNLALRTLEAITRAFASAGFPLHVTSTDRSQAEQERLYALGRTNLPPGRSLHEQGRAFDVVPAFDTRGREIPYLQAIAGIVDGLVLVEGRIRAVAHGRRGGPPDHVHIETPSEALELDL